VLIVQTCHGRTQRFDTGGRTVFPRSGGDGDRRRAGKTSFDLVVGLGGTLAKIGPAVGILGIAMLGSSLCAPDDTSGSTGGIETGVRTVALVGGTELAMSLGLLLWKIGPVSPNCFTGVCGI